MGAVLAGARSYAALADWAATAEQAVNVDRDRLRITSLTYRDADPGAARPLAPGALGHRERRPLGP